MSFTSPEKDFFIYIYEVITSPEKEKRSTYLKLPPDHFGLNRIYSMQPEMAQEYSPAVSTDKKIKPRRYRTNSRFP
jgi:hypothetical protein